jgi:hypothetical protein
VVAKEDSLNPPFNDNPRPNFFHVSPKDDAPKLFVETHRVKFPLIPPSPPRGEGKGEGSIQF